MMNDLGSKKTVKNLDGKPVTAEAKLSAATVVKELNRYQSIVSMTPWGTFDFTDAFDKDPMQPFVTLFDKYDSEGKIEVPEAIVWRTDPPAQWGSAGKNSKHLATLIAQYFEKEIFPEWMADRCHWKLPQPNIKSVDSEQKCPSNDLGEVLDRRERQAITGRVTKGSEKGGNCAMNPFENSEFFCEGPEGRNGVDPHDQG